MKKDDKTGNKAAAGNPVMSLFSICCLPLTACWLLFAAPCALRAEGAGSTSVQILKADMSPRAMAMAGSFAAVADDVYTGFEDSKLQYLTFGMPAPITGLGGLEKPGMAVSAIFSQNGEFINRVLNADDTVSVGNAVSAEGTSVLAFSYGEKIFSNDVKIDAYNARFEQYLGLSAKYIHSTLLEEYSASAFALDAGWLVKEPDLGFSFGASLANYGSGLKYLKDSNPLPSIARLGLSWQGDTIRDHSILLSLEGDFYTGEKLSSLRTGMEYNFEKMFNFRLGYKAREDNSGPTMGIGAHHQGFAVDLAISLGNKVYNTTQVAFTYQFTGWDTGKARKARYEEQVEERPKPKKSVKPAKKAPVKPKKQEPAEPIRKNSDFYWVN
jgi:hypothetical protein